MFLRYLAQSTLYTPNTGGSYSGLAQWEITTLLHHAAVCSWWKVCSLMQDGAWLFSCLRAGGIVCGWACNPSPGPTCPIWKAPPLWREGLRGPHLTLTQGWSWRTSLLLLNNHFWIYNIGELPGCISVYMYIFRTFWEIRQCQSLTFGLLYHRENQVQKITRTYVFSINVGKETTYRAERELNSGPCHK